MSDPRRKIDDLILRIKKSEVAPEKAWDEIRKLKEEYVQRLRVFDPSVKDAEQSWHIYIGNKFQKVVYSIIKGYVTRLKAQDQSFRGLEVLTESEVKRKEVVMRKLAVKYGEYLLLPDTDMVIVNYVSEEPWQSEILAIISCKTSLRERIAQACYWKLKLLSSNITKNIRVFLATADNDMDFTISSNRRESFNGKSRDRIIAEHELDGVYILREDFREEWESAKVKRYERIFDDLNRIFMKK
jgi:type II restriction enzyme